MHGYVNTEMYWTKGSGSKMLIGGPIKPFVAYRKIERGRFKGKIEVEIHKIAGTPKRILVKPGAIRRYPSNNDQIVG